jgi:hypothetical protein
MRYGDYKAKKNHAAKSCGHIKNASSGFCSVFSLHHILHFLVMLVFDLLYHWVDLLWVPIFFFGVHKKHRWYALGFAIGTIILVHTLSEIMVSIGYPTGIISYMSSNVHSRLLITSSIIYSIFLIIAHYSPGTRGVVFMAASLTFFFLTLVISSIIMVL